MLPTIGLEVHTQLNTKTKLFCYDKNDSDGTRPNVNICPVCMGHPGTLPVLNKEAVRKILRAGIALGASINQFSKFDRKNYFYPDLPKGYQISQYDIPFCVSGRVYLSSEKEIRIRRIHLEEDTGRLIHQRDASLVDFNRAGVPLMELVTEPDFGSSDEAVEFAKKLHTLWQYLEISQADMEKGQMRLEANISLDMGTKVEVKNLNSFKALKEGIEYELKRQEEILKKGAKVLQETRGWDPGKRRTFAQREKESEKDYRYFPEPDLPPVVVTDQELTAIRNTIPELPWERETRFVQEYTLPLTQVHTLVEQKEAGEYFEEVASELKRWEEDVERPDVIKEHLPALFKLSANYLITEFPRIELSLPISRPALYENITPENFAELMVLTHQGVVSSSGAQLVLFEMAKRGGEPDHIIKEQALAQVSKKDELGVIAQAVIQENQKAVADYKKGKETAITFLVGKVMAKSKGKANPQIARELLEEFLQK